MGIKKTLLIIVGLALLTLTAWGENEPTLILVLSRPTDTATDPKFQKIIDNYMSFELNQRRLRALTESELHQDLQPGLQITDESGLQSRLISLGQSTEADFVILCRFSRAREKMNMLFEFFDIRNERLLSRAKKEQSLALLMDWSISDVIDEMLATAEGRLVYVTEPQPSTETASAETDTETEITAEPTPDPDKVEKEVTHKKPKPVVVLQPERTVSVVTISKHIELAAGMAPFVAIGQASSYFRLGLFPSLSSRYRFNTKIGQIGLGILGGVLSFYAESALSAVQNFIIPLAIQLSYERRRVESTLALLFHFEGGPALFAVNPNETGYQMKIIPYLSTGVSLDIAFSSALGLLIDLSYAVYLVQTYPIMGYLPSIYFYVRL